MVVKLFVLFALVAAVSATDFSFFAYGVADPYTNDYKKQYECRTGDKVEGQYSLLEPDGTNRIVDYVAGAQGFNAVVRKDPALIGEAPAAYTAPPYGFYHPYAYNYDKFGTYGYTAPNAFKRFY